MSGAQRAPSARDARSWRARGQSVVEFALILPVALLIVGAVLDVSRVYFAWIDLESATRHAAEWVAENPGYTTTGGYYDSTDTANYCNATFPCASAPTSDAKIVMDRSVGTSFTKVYTAPTCSSVNVPTVWAAIVSTPSTATSDGGNAAYPVATARVKACYPFRTLFSYPFFTFSGAWHLSVDRTFTIIVGR